MTVRIGSNTGVLSALRSLSRTTNAQSSTLERLASGLRINKASDDAAGLAIAENLKSKSRVYGQAIRNVNDGVSLVNIAQGALGQLSTITIRQKELAEQAANGTYSNKQRVSLQKESDALVKEYNRITQSTAFNGEYVLDGTNDRVRIQQGYGVEQSTLLEVGQQIGLAAGDGTLAGNATIGVGNYTARTIGDLNNDGFLDVVGTNTGSTIQVALGRGDGTFTELTLQNYVGQAFRLNNLADIDGDGNLDVVSSNSNGTLSILRGNGNGTFGAVQAVGTALSGANVYNGVVKDMDGDGRLDALSVDYSGGRVLMWKGNGDGTFQSRTITANTAFNFHFDVGDINGDGRQDILLDTNLLIQNEDGTFRNGPNVGSASAPVRLADIDNDGNLDVVRATGTPNLSFYRGNGDGTFGSVQSRALGYLIGDFMEIRDLNGDGNLDIIGGAAASGYGISIGNGQGNFTLGTTSATQITGANTRLHFGDFNSDGVADFTSGQFGTYAVTLMRADATGRRNNLLERFDLTSPSGAREALTRTTTQLNRINSEYAMLGAVQSRLESSLNSLASTRENVDTAAARITDADIAQETADLTRQQILTQFAANVIGMAKLEPQLALKLLQ